MVTQRFNVGWLKEEPNGHFFGLTKLIQELEGRVTKKHGFPPPKMKMLEIGSYMGESTMLFASSNLFSEIHCVEPFNGYEKFNDDNDYHWGFIYDEFKTNTRFFDNITLHKDFSYNIVNDFEDASFDFIYIDANHEYEDVKRDIELCLPKLKSDGIIAGHDYHENWPGVVKSVNELLGEPNHVFWDTSWIRYEI